MAFSLVMRLEWLKSGAPSSKAFRLPGSGELYEEYASRIGRYCSFQTAGGAYPKAGTRAGTGGGGKALWACDPRGKALTSKQLAERLQKARDGGIGSVEIIIGGPDGLSSGASTPEFRWSFGPMTLPHELAAVVAAEQLYRAWTIISGQPYHLGH